MNASPETPLANNHKAYGSSADSQSSVSSKLHRRPGSDVEEASFLPHHHTPLTMRTRLKRPSLAACLRWNSAYIFLILVFVLFLKAGFYANEQRHPGSVPIPVTVPSSPSSSPSSSSPLAPLLNTKSTLAQHPIQRLMEDAEEVYRAKLARQSNTLREAVVEYKRRYGRPPPKGFDEWWAFAKKREVVMVDEYDGLVGDLAPFWELSGEELRRRADQVGELPSIDLVRIRDGVVTTVNMQHGFQDSEVSARAKGFSSMIGKFKSKLPDMDFPINAKAEGRVLVPWEHRQMPNLTVVDSSAGIESVLGGPFRPDWGDDGNNWEAWRRTCPPEAPARQLYSSLRNPFANQVHHYLPSHSTGTASITPTGESFSFSRNTSSQLDYCLAPWAHYTQGHFFSDWRSIPALYPVFSPAKAKGFLDIRIPSHYYYGSTQRYTYGWDSVNLELRDVDPMEVPWEEKEEKVFWRGATTGGGNHPPGFQPQFQRHRFLRLTSDQSQDTNISLTFAYPPSSSPPSSYETLPIPLGTLNTEMMDTAFVKLVGEAAYPGGLQALMDAHRFGDSVPLGRHWAYKYLVDLDGMSYSGRFMAFLASDSVPVKATVYEEYFHDWIEPWVHFIPLSSSYKEIYNIVSYFSGPPSSAVAAITGSNTSTPEQRRSAEGDVRLRRIARAGKQWKKTIGRTMDMEVYVYRLCLEWGRLWADDRDSMNFEL